MSTEPFEETQILVAAIESMAESGHWRFDPKTTEFSWSNFASEILGYKTKEEQQGLTLLKSTFVDQGEAFLSQVNKTMESGESFTIDCFVKTPQEETRKVKISGMSVSSQHEKDNQVVGLIKDITSEDKYLTQLVESQRLLEATSAVAKIGYWRLDLLDGELFWSDEVYRIHGHEIGEFTPQLENAIEAYHPDDRKMVEEAVGRSQASGEPFGFTARIVRPSGEVRHVISRGQTRKEANVDVVMFGVFQDITEQVKTQEQSRLWDYLVNETPEAVVITDAEGMTIWANKSFESLSGYELAEFIGQAPGKLLQGPDTDPETIKQISQAIQEKRSITVEILNYSKVGEPYWIMLSIFPRFNDRGELSQFMAIEVDISDRVESERLLTEKQKDLESLNFRLERQKQAAEDIAQKEAEARLKLEQEIKKSQRLQEELRALANTDALTGIANRRYFLKRAESEFQRAKRYDENLHVVMFDIDYFKNVNDTFGHQVGDETLQAVTNSTIKCLREDVDFLGRLGGEEFCLLLPHTLKDDALAVAERIRTAIELTTVNTEVKVTCSFGVAQTNSFDDFKSAMSMADKALYEAKESGRNKVVYWK